MRDSWIKNLKNLTSDVVKKHVMSEMHKQAANLVLKKELGPKRYLDNDWQNLPIRKTVTKMNKKSKKGV